MSQKKRMSISQVPEQTGGRHVTDHIVKIAVEGSLKYTAGTWTVCEYHLSWHYSAHTTGWTTTQGSCKGKVSRKINEQTRVDACSDIQQKLHRLYEYDEAIVRHVEVLEESSRHVACPTEAQSLIMTGGSLSSSVWWCLTQRMSSSRTRSCVSWTWVSETIWRWRAFYFFSVSFRFLVSKTELQRTTFEWRGDFPCARDRAEECNLWVSKIFSAILGLNYGVDYFLCSRFMK